MAKGGGPVQGFPPHSAEVLVNRAAFGLPKTASTKQAKKIVCGVWVEEQRQAVKRIFDAPSKFIGVKRSWDETACRLYSKDDTHLQKILSDLGLPASLVGTFGKKRVGAIFNIMQQRASVRCTGVPCHPVYIPGKIVERTTATCIFEALNVSMPELSSESLQKLLQDPSLEWLFVALMGDSIASNRLAQAGLARSLPNAIVDCARCLMHQAQLAFLGGVRPLNLTGVLYSLSSGLAASGPQDKLLAALGVESKQTRIIFAKPPGEAAAYGDWLLDLTLARFVGIESLRNPEKAAEVTAKLAAAKAKIKRGLNGRFWLNRAEHWCWQEDGSPCCESVVDTYAKVCDAYYAVASLIFHPGNTASESKWFKLIQGAKGWCFGLGCHGFLLKALKRIAPLTPADTMEALRDNENDDHATFFAKRLKRGAKRLSDPSACHDLVIMLGTCGSLEAFTYTLMQEGHDDRMNSDRPGIGGLLRRLLADDRALLRKTAKAYDDLMSDAETISRLTLRHEVDDVDISWKSRSTRGLIVRSSGQYWHRFTEHHKDSPGDFVVAQDKAKQGKFQERDDLHAKFLAKRTCCLQPFFCRRIRKRLAGQPDSEAIAQLQTESFDSLVDFWSNDAETATSIRNELQHSNFTNNLRGKRRGALNSVDNAVSNHFWQTIRQDHECHFGQHRKPATKHAFSRVRKSILKAFGPKSNFKTKATTLELGTGRTPWLHFRNKRQKQEKAERRARGDKKRIRQAEWDVLIPQFKAEWDASPATQELCTREVVAARNHRREELDRIKFCKKRGIAPPAPPEAVGPSTDAQDEAIQKNTLWQLGDRAGPLRADAIVKYAASSNVTSTAGLEAHLHGQNASSLCGSSVPDRQSFDRKAVAAWRSRVRPCQERHPGLCAVEAGALYGSALAFTSRLQHRIAQVHNDSAGSDHWMQAGMGIYRCKAISAPPLAPGGQECWIMLSFYMGKPRLCAFIELEAGDAQDDVGPTLRIPVPLIHTYGHAVALKLLLLHHGPWEISEAKYKDLSLREVVVVDVFSPASFLLFLLCFSMSMA